MNTTVPVRLFFADGKHQRRTVDLSFDLTASPEVNDPATVAARLALLHGLSDTQQSDLRASICDQLHGYALFILSTQGRVIGQTSIVSGGLHLPGATQLGQLAAASAAAYTGGPTATPPQPLIGNLLALAGLHAAPSSSHSVPPAPPSHPQVALGPAATPGGGGSGGGAATVNSGPGASAGEHRPRTYMTKRRRLLAEAAAGNAPPASPGASATAKGGSATGGSVPLKSGAAAAGSDEDDEVLGDDGNVDYCDLCDDAGDLICCDRCPRSYHLKCLRVRSVPDGEWRCPECVRAFGAHGEYESGAATAAGPVVTALFDGPFRAPLARRGASALEELTGIVDTLCDHEFAVPFSTPVDVAAVPGYAAAVKHPRDLGTVREGLRTGGNASSSPELDIPRVITDLRLVFHNCRLFNKPLSTIWRMADVLFRELETALRDRVALTAAQTARLDALRQAELPPLPALPPFGGGAK